MAPSIWLVNFALLYILNPSVAASMPAVWAPIPSNVADAHHTRPMCRPASVTKAGRPHRRDNCAGLRSRRAFGR